MFQKLLYYFTIHLPLIVRDLCINFFALFIGHDYAIEIARKLLKERVLIGILPDGNLVFLPLDDFKMLPMISEIYFQKIYDVRQIEKSNCICDVGAHIGLFTLRVSKQAPLSKIIAIEPHPVNFEFLTKNIFVNGLSSRVQALNLAIGKRKGKTILLLSKISRGDSSVKKWHNAGHGGFLTVNISTLDNILSRQESCDLIKIDVEGMEMDVLRGLQKSYKVKRLVMEIHISLVNVTEIYEWLSNHGFVITRTQKLYSDCVLLEAQRPCA